MRNVTEEKRLAKNKQISLTKRTTLERHSHMQVKTFDVKIQLNKCNQKQKEVLQKIFLEQKWFKNYVLDWSHQSKENKINKFNTTIKIITKKNRDFEDEEVKLEYLASQMKVALIGRMYSNIKTLHTLKEKGLQKPGKLKFSKEENCIGLVQYGISYKFVSSKRVKIQGLGKPFPVNGTNQFLNIEGIEYCNARLLRRPTGYYIQVVCYVPKENKKQEKIDKVLGIDFGCETSFTTSEGEKINVSIEESERLKRLAKQNNRRLVKSFNLKYGYNPNFKNKKDRQKFKRIKRSNNWNKTNLLIQKAYQKQTNQKNDIANKIVHKFCNYETVVMQDEQLHNWQKGNHGKKIQHSVLGKVKSKLKEKTNVVILGRNVPTTKLCTKCGVWHDELKAWDRTFKCDCGVEMDRDIHAAQNMIWFYENNVGVERTKIKRVEMEAIVAKALKRSETSNSERSSFSEEALSKKHEAECL